jgi:hypothetical protein
LGSCCKLTNGIGRLEPDSGVVVGERTGERGNELEPFETPDSAHRLLPDERVAVRQPLSQRRQVGVGLRACVFGGDEACT